MRSPDFVYKVMAFLIAVTLAVYVHSERNPYESRTLSVALNIDGAAGLSVRTAPKSVAVAVSGPRDRVAQIDATSLQASVNLKGRKAGQQSLKVLVSPAPGAAIPPEVEITPLESRVNVTLTGTSRQKRAIEPVFLQPPPSGFTYATPVVSPSAGTITGPEEAVRSVTRLQVLVDVSPLPGQPIDAVRPVQAVNSSGSVVPDVVVTPTDARVSAQVQDLPLEKEVLVTPNITGIPLPDQKIAQISVVPQAVVLTGNPQTLRRLNFVLTQEINLAGAEGTVVRSVAINLPDGVSVQGSRRVRVEIRLAPR